MFMLKKMITSFLLPPGIFVILLFFLSYRLNSRKRSGAALSVLLMALLLWAVSITPTSRYLMSTLENSVRPPETLHGDVIVLLGGGIHDNVPDMSGKGAPSDDMMGRIVTAVRAYRVLKVPVIVAGGIVYSGSSAEAPVVRRFLVDLGVPYSQVILEDKSRDTIENARFTKEIMLSKGFQKPLLVTSAYHMKRSIEAFRKTGMTVMPLPAQFHSGGDRHLILTDWFPDAGKMGTSAKALREQIGLLFYRIL